MEPFRQVAARLTHEHATYRGGLEAWQEGARMRKLLDRGHREVPLPVSGLLLSSQLGRMIGADPGEVVEVEILEGGLEVFSVRIAGWLDDYVGVSNFNTHLRAGLGLPMQVLVPFPPEWRWGLSGRSGRSGSA